MSENAFDPYAVLGIPPDSGTEAIRQAWRDAARRHHPDAGGDAEMFKLAQRAFQLLATGEGRGVRGGSEPEPTHDPNVVHDGEIGSLVSVEIMIDHRVAVFGGTERITRWRITYCPECSGRGERCAMCRGEGLVGRYHATVVNIPPRSVHGDVISLYQGGDAGRRKRGVHGRAISNAGPYGNLDIRVLVDRHPQILESGDDLVTQIQIDMYDAALGCEISVTGLDGVWPLQVPAGTQPGARLRLPGKGRPKPENGRGDLIAVVEVCIPERLDALERVELESLRRGRRRGGHSPTGR